MEVDQAVKIGMEHELFYQVEEKHTAVQIGSGAIRVLSTPSMIGFMERTCHQFLASYLPDRLSSVGAHVDISHLAPTPVGATLKVRCKVMRVEGNQVSFEVEAWDDIEKIGAGKHLRVIVEQDRFLRRVAKKNTELGLSQA